MRLARKSLLWKGTFFLALSSLAVLALFSFFFSRFIYDKFLDRTQSYGLFLLQAVEKGFFQSMVHEDRKFVDTLFQDLSRHPEIKMMAVYDHNGRLAVSSVVGQGLSVDPGRALAESRQGYAAVRASMNGENTLVLARPVVNEEGCHSCHPRERKLLGTMGIELSVKGIEEFHKASRAILYMMMGILGLVLMVVNVGFFGRFVVNPLDRLNLKMKEVEGGNMEVPFSGEEGDEIAGLERSFGNMVEKLRRHHQMEIEGEKQMALMVQDLKHQMEIAAVNKQLASRVQEIDLANRKINRLAARVEEKNLHLSKMVKRISALNRLGVALSAELEMEKLIRMVVSVAVKGLRAERGFLTLLDEEGKKLRLAYGMGLGEEYDQSLPVELGESISGLVAERGEAILIEDIAKDSQFKRVSRYGFLRKSVICAPLRVKDRMMGTIELTNKKGEEIFTSDDLETLSSMCSQAAIAIDNAKLYQKIQKSYFDTVRALIQAVEEKDQYTRGHSERVTLFSLKIAEMMGLDQQKLSILKYAGYLHDIGKIGIDINILQKKGKLDTEEYNLVKNHPLIGERIIAPIEFLKDVRDCVSQHHERFDGQGYPMGLKGVQMGLEARILAVADAYDAMITDRPYRKAYPKEHAVAELRQCSGTQFDPEVVEIFLEVLETDQEVLELEKGLFAVGT